MRSVCLFVAFTAWACAGNGKTAPIEMDAGMVDDMSADGGADGSGADANEGVGRIAAAAGGVIQSGDVSITIPPNALSTDTNIAIAEVAPSATPSLEIVRSATYELGPSGLTFATPVILRFSIKSDFVPEDNHVAAYYDASRMEWFPLHDSTRSDRTVTATTTHFSMYALVVSANAALGVDFSKCSGPPGLDQQQRGRSAVDCGQGSVYGAGLGSWTPLPGAGQYINRTCRVHYSSGAITVHSDEPQPFPYEGTVVGFAYLDGSGVDHVIARGTDRGSPVTHIHASNEGVNARSEVSIWIDYNGNLSYVAVANSQGGGIICGTDYRAVD